MAGTISGGPVTAQFGHHVFMNHVTRIVPKYYYACVPIGSRTVVLPRC